jgi:hypothetical protein
MMMQMQSMQGIPGMQAPMQNQMMPFMMPGAMPNMISSMMPTARGGKYIPFKAGFTNNF